LASVLPSSKTFTQFVRLLSDLPPRRWRALAWLLPLSLIPGLLDFASVAVVGRLTGALVGGRLNNLVPGLKVFGGNHVDQALWLIGLFVGLIWLRSLSKVLLAWLQERIGSGVWLDLSNSIFRRILSQPYSYHIDTSHTQLSSDVLGSLQSLLKEVVTPALKAIGSVTSIVILTGGIIYIGRSTALGLLLVMISSYLLMSVVITPPLRRASRQKLHSRQRFTQLFFEAFRSIKDIKLVGAADYFSSGFSAATTQFKLADTISILLPSFPRLLIEPLGISAIFLLGAVPRLMSGDKQQVLEILPFLATLAVAALRLTQPMQDLFSAIARLRGGLPEISKILSLLELPQSDDCLAENHGLSPAGVLPKRTIGLRHVSYRYPRSDRWVLRDLNLSIGVGSRIAFVGATGSGKSTAAYLLLSLLTPQQGSLELDGVVVDERDRAAWHSCCSHVPQNIQLLNDSVLHNVAFGQPADQVDVDLVWESLEAAQMAETVADLPYGVYTQIGENGINLSGGQRQRIALARAFYRRSQFLVLDEATSALDNQTESDVIQALEIIGRRCTTVVIAHRLSTVQRCDRIYEFREGRIVASGTYDSLLACSEGFRNLVHLEQQER
jgi:ATP-binding cassette subfamily B protein